MKPAGRFLIIFCAIVALVAIGLLASGHPLAALLVLLSPLILTLAVFGGYAVLAAVAFGLGRLDAVRRGRARARAGRPDAQSGEPSSTFHLRS